LWTINLERIILTLVGERSKAMSAEGSDDVRGISKNVPHNFTMSPAYPLRNVREGESRDSVYGNRRFNPLRGRDYLFLV
jgi:hypothetical protein